MIYRVKVIRTPLILIQQLLSVKKSFVKIIMPQLGKKKFKVIFFFKRILFFQFFQINILWHLHFVLAYIKRKKVKQRLSLSLLFYPETKTINVLFGFLCKLMNFRKPENVVSQCLHYLYKVHHKGKRQAMVSADRLSSLWVIIFGTCRQTMLVLR